MPFRSPSTLPQRESAQWELTVKLRYEKSRTRYDLMRLLAPPVGLEETSKTLGSSNQTEMAVTPAVTFAAKVNCTADEIDLLDAYRRLPEDLKKQVLQMLQDICR